MSDERIRGSGEGGGGAREREFDSELDFGSIVKFGIGLAITTAVVLAAVGWMSTRFKSAQEARDPNPSPLAEARAPKPPPEPRLQTSPPRDMEQLRAEEDAILGGYGWVDAQRRIGRIPIERAMDILAETGLPSPPPAASSEKPPGGTERRP